MAPSALGRIGYLRVEPSPTRQVTACIHNPRPEAWPKTCLPAMLNGGRLNDTRPAVLCDWHCRQKGPLVLWRDKAVHTIPQYWGLHSSAGLISLSPLSHPLPRAWDYQQAPAAGTQPGIGLHGKHQELGLQGPVFSPP